MLGLAVGSFLNVCIHRLPRGQSLSLPPSRCPSCELSPVVVRQHPGRQLRCCWRPMPQVPRPDLDPLSAGRARHDGVVRRSMVWCLAGARCSCRGCCSRARWSCCSPSISSITAAKRHHASRDRDRADLQRRAAARARRRAHRRAGRRRRAVADRRGVLPLLAVTRAWAAETSRCSR